MKVGRLNIQDNTAKHVSKRELGSRNGDLKNIMSMKAKMMEKAKYGVEGGAKEAWLGDQWK